jgi:soluble lytic murein transglycosylase-like protein
MNAKFRFRIICGAAIGLLLSPVFLASSDFISRLQDKYDGLIKSIAAEHGLEGRFVHAVIRAESAYNRFAVSAKGAQGLMQLMPATAAAYGVRDVFDPADNIRGGVKFLKVLWELYGGNASKTLAAYNAGQEAVKKYGGIPPYAETRTYIDRVIASYQAPMPGRKTRIYEYRDDQGRLVLTNDPRLAAGRGIDGGN